MKNKGEINLDWTILIIILLVWCSVEDIKAMKIPLIGMALFAIIGILLSIFNPVFSLVEILGGVLIGIFLLFVSWISKGAIAKGDGLLIGTCGLYLGFWGNMALLSYGLLLSGITSGFLLITRQLRQKQKIPFVPFLLCAYIGMVMI